jgi:hypothetical protein
MTQLYCADIESECLHREMKGQVGLEQLEERYAEDTRDIGGLVHGQEIYRALSDDAIHVAEQETGPRFSLCTVGNRVPFFFGKQGDRPHEIRVAYGGADSATRAIIEEASKTTSKTSIHEAINLSRHCCTNNNGYHWGILSPGEAYAHDALDKHALDALGDTEDTGLPRINACGPQDAIHLDLARYIYLQSPFASRMCNCDGLHVDILPHGRQEVKQKVKLAL